MSSIEFQILILKTLIFDYILEQISQEILGTKKKDTVITAAQCL